MLVRMYTAKERETRIIETAQSSRLGGFDVHGLCKRVCGHRLHEDVKAKQLPADGLAMRKVADLFVLVSRGHRSDRIPRPPLGEPTVLCSRRMKVS